MKYSLRFFAIFAIAFVSVFCIVPQVTHASDLLGPLVPCGNLKGTDYKECTICDLIILAANVLRFLVAASVLVAALLFLNAGVLYVLSPTNPSNIARAHSLFISTLIGLVVILAAWLIVNLIMDSLYDTRHGQWTELICA